jgi:putative membrane protein
VAAVTLLLAASDPAWWRVWVLDLPSVAFLLGVGALYAQGELLRRRQTGVPRPGRVAAFTSGWVVVLLSVVSPVAGLAGELLWVHMVQHLLMTVVAAPLVALGAPQATIRRALRPRTRAALARAVRRWSLRRRDWAPPPVMVAAAAHAAAMWVWHAPALYDLAATNAAVHLLEHAMFLGTAVWFWTAVVAATRRGRRQHALATLSLGGLIAQGGVLGALMTFAPRSVYAAYDGGWGMTALEDQQVAGTLMWVPPGFVYAIAGIALFVRWFEIVERDARRREAARAPAEPPADHRRAEPRRPATLTDSSPGPHGRVTVPGPHATPELSASSDPEHE